MRLFIACPLGEDVKAFCAQAQRELSGLAFQARLTPGVQMHLTLRFIGEADARAVQRLCAWFRALNAPAGLALSCMHEGYGFFRGGEGVLVYAALRCDPALKAFIDRMERDIRGMGFAPETRPWKEHVTLARNAAFATAPEAALEALPRMDAPFTLLPPVLYLSEFLPGGVRHTPIAYTEK